MKQIKRITSVLLAMIMLCALAPVCAAENISDTDAVRYSDIENIDETTKAAIETVSERGIMMGDTEGTFRPYDNITREEAAAVVGRMLGIDTADCGDPPFTDVAPDSFAAGYIARLAEIGLTKGVGDGLFEPSSNVTVNDLALMLTRAVKTENNKDEIDEALLDGISETDTSKAVMRGDAAIMLANAIKIQDTDPTAETTAAPVSGINAFAMNMNAELNKINENKNYMFSPLSIKMALSMAANGADGVTKSEILSALSVDDLDEYNENAKRLTENYNKYDFDYAEYNRLGKKLEDGSITDEEYEKWEKMYDDLSQNEDAYLSIANSIWVNKDYKTDIGYDPEFKSDFIKIAADKFDAETGIVGSDDAVQKINDWTSEKTNGKIPTIIDSSDFLAALINAVYFNARWADEFSEYATEKAEFTNADGSKTETDFMNNTGYYDYYKDDNAEILRMPYKGGSTAMYISIDDGDIQNYDEYFSKLADTNADTYVKVSMPKFKIEYSADLNDVLKRLGINDAFDMDAADFTNMLDGIPSTENVYIDKVLHKTYISIDEKGTEAAAVTAVMMVGTASLPPEPTAFIADRPFTFIIRDETGGEIIFMGRFNTAIGE